MCTLGPPLCVWLCGVAWAGPAGGGIQEGVRRSAVLPQLQHLMALSLTSGAPTPLRASVHRLQAPRGAVGEVMAARARAMLQVSALRSIRG